MWFNVSARRGRFMVAGPIILFRAALGKYVPASLPPVSQSPRSFFSVSRALASREVFSAGGMNSRRMKSKYSQ